MFMHVWVEAWLPDAQARSAKVALASWRTPAGVMTSNGRSLDLFYVCLYVCMYVLYGCICVNVYMCICIFVYLCRYVWTCMYVYISACVCVCMGIYVYVYLYACMYLCTFVCVCTYANFRYGPLCVHIYVRIFVCMYVLCMHVHVIIPSEGMNVYLSCVCKYLYVCACMSQQIKI